MKRTLCLVTTALAALLLSTDAGWSKPQGGGGGGGGGGGDNTFSGQAVVVDATVLGINTVVSDTGPLPSSGGALETSLLTVNVSGLVTADVAHATTIGQGDRSRSEASVADVTLTVGGNTIGADLLMSRAMAQCSVLTGDSQLVNLVINGHSITLSGSPNQTVDLVVGKVIINEQILGNGSITVNALHVIIPGVADVVVSSAEADITCNGGPCTGGDFFTGGGFITAPDGAKGTFGVGGGLKNGSLWGHLEYIDHGNDLKVHANSITSYVVTGTLSRRITGTWDGGTFTVDVTDSTQPGGENDSFVISLSNGYSAGGKLGGGNITLHKPCFDTD